MKNEPTFSIIIPCKNGMPYLVNTMKSVLSSQSKRIEVLVSVDSSSDGTLDYAFSLKDPRIRVLQPSRPLSMSEHWDFAQSQARGDWQLFLGQDDLLMNGYAEALDRLVAEAESQGTKAIVCRRAYVCWPPISDSKLKALQYWHSSEMTVRSSLDFVREALTSDISYHAGPQMYTSSIISRSLLNEIRDTQKGTLVLGHPQDAFLAASILKTSKNFVYCGKPFSWVGTSDKSAGLAITSRSKSETQKKLAQNYLASIEQNKNLTYSSAVDFSHGVNARYFFDALVKVWPSALNTVTKSNRDFSFTIDVNIAASCVNANKSFREFKLLAVEKREFLLKFAFGWSLSSLRWAASKFLRIAAFVGRPILSERTGLIILNSVEDSDELFRRAMSKKCEAGPQT